MLQAKFGYRLDDPKWAPDWLPNEQLEMLHSDIDARQIIDGEFEQITKDLRVSITGLCACLIRLRPARSLLITVHQHQDLPAKHMVRVCALLDVCAECQVNMYILLQVLRREIIKSGEHNIQQPVNLKRLLWNAQRVFDKEQGGKAQSSKAACDAALV